MLLFSSLFLVIVKFWNKFCSKTILFIKFLPATILTFLRSIHFDSCKNLAFLVGLDSNYWECIWILTKLAVAVKTNPEKPENTKMPKRRINICKLKGDNSLKANKNGLLFPTFDSFDNLLTIHSNNKQLWLLLICYNNDKGTNSKKGQILNKRKNATKSKSLKKTNPTNVKVVWCEERGEEQWREILRKSRPTRRRREELHMSRKLKQNKKGQNGKKDFQQFG